MVVKYVFNKWIFMNSAMKVCTWQFETLRFHLTFYSIEGSAMKSEMQITVKRKVSK